jgi:nitrogen PTS system EIIA component
MKLADIIVHDAIVPELKAQTREDVVEELVQALASAGAIPKKSIDDVVKAVMARESQATTGIGKGVALPHAKLKGVKKPLGAIGRSGPGIDFAALDGKPVYSVILLLSNPDNPDEHLQAMETIFKHVQRDIFRKFLRQAQTQQAITELIQEADELLG